jgi:5'-3' exonuclease
MRKVDRVDVIVAPYEADAQLMYLTQIGIAHAILTIDTDLIVYGCEKVSSEKRHFLQILISFSPPHFFIVLLILTNIFVLFV